MSRFDQLEFEDKTPKPNGDGSASTTGEATRDAVYFYKKALQYWLMADFELALRNFSRSLEQNKTFFEAWSGQLQMLIELEEFPETVTWADKALELFPEHPELMALKSVAFVRDKHIAEALAWSDNALSKENPTGRVWLARAEILLSKNTAIAENCINSALSIGGREKDLLCIEAARLLSRYGRYSASLEYFQRAVKLFPKSALVWFEMAKAQEKLAMPQTADSFRQALFLRPGWDSAKKQLDAVLKQSPIRRLFKLLFRK